MSEVFTLACHNASCLQCISLEPPVGKIISTTHEISALPLKPMEGSTKLKAVVEKVFFEHVGDVDFDSVEHLVQSKAYQQLPGNLALKDQLSDPIVLQLVFGKVNANKYLVLKHYTFSQKVDARLIKQIAVGDLFVIDYGKNFRAGSAGFQYLLEHVGDYAILAFQFSPKPKAKAKDKSALEKGFAYIQSEGPKSDMNNQWTEWAEIEVNREESPIFGWNTGPVKESLKGYVGGNVFAQPTENFFLTIHALNVWFLEDVLIPLLPGMKNKTPVFLGNAGAGKTPAASAIAMAFSEHWLFHTSDTDKQPSFSLASSFDQLRGEPGVRERPDILDDGDMSQQALPNSRHSSAAP